MKYTLLEMVQRILESMDSDEVGSYGETVESTAVANIIKETYWFLVGESDLPATHTFFKLDASGDNTKPVLMTLPSDVLDMDYLKYQTPDESSNTEYNFVLYLDIEEFLSRTLILKEDLSTVSTMTVALDGTNFEFKYYTDRKPEFYTNIDGYNLVFNAYNSSVDSTLQSSKTLCFGNKIPTFTMSDSFTPQLDPTQFALLLNTARGQAFTELKQVENATSERRARKSKINTQRQKRNIPSYKAGHDYSPDYGRRK